MNRALSAASGFYPVGLPSGMSHPRFRERRDIGRRNLPKDFECMATKLVVHKLTRNPLGYGSAHIDTFIEGVYHFEKRLARLPRATRRIKCFTKALTNRDVKTIKFPSRYLTKREDSFDTLQL
jgi:hypothetical protein